MKYICPAALAALVAAGTFAITARPPAPELKDFRAPVASPQEHVKGFLWLEAEGFADYGDWRLDTQFTHKMGSAYLLAVGVLKPINAARTTVRIPSAGTWRVWARTKDWLPEFSPGTFTIAVGGTRGETLGASKKEGWRWERAGDFALATGETEVALVDLSGAFARCDALLFTSDLSYVPPDDAEALEAARERFADGRAGARLSSCGEGGEFDVVVVGSGTAGMGAALAAARAGARVALVHDRPVMGGNSSVELGIGTDGAAGSHPNRKLNMRETGLCEEANLMRGRAETKTLSGAYRLMVDAEPRLTEIPNQRVLSVEKDGDAITSVIGRDTLTGRRTRYRAKLFIDCTGDGWVGYFADAAYMYGREAQSEYNEWPAPETRDNLTMSGCLMDRCVAYTYAVRSEPVPYTTPAWADVLPAGFTRRVNKIAPSWWIEHGGRFDDLKDPERARDELVRISFAYWGWLKNVSHLKDERTTRCAEITFVPFMNGRREGMRLTGDYVLTANDALEGKMFPDRITYGGWPLDTHDPLGMDNPNGNGYWKHHPGVPTYSIPYRCLYSKNVPNLMFAGRCQSVTHIALGSVRVEATLFTLGQAAGTAAALAVQKGLPPREYGQRHITELQQRLLKDDQYIPGLKNEDPLDLARGAKVTATSVATAFKHTKFNDKNLRNRDHTVHELAMSRATCFPRGALDRLEKIECLLASELSQPKEVTLRVYGMDEPSADPAARTLLATATRAVPANKKSVFVPFKFAKPVALTQSYVWVELGAARGVSWFLRNSPLTPDGCRAWGGGHWTLVKGMQYAVVTTPALSTPVNSSAAAVVDGVARPEGDQVHGWISDPEAALPQAIRLDFPKPTEVRQVRLTFDTDLTPTRVGVNPYPPTLVKSYMVEGFDGEKWIPLASEERNDLRLHVHDIAPTTLTALRVTVTETWGDPSARVFEIRVY